MVPAVGMGQWFTNGIEMAVPWPQGRKLFTRLPKSPYVSYHLCYLPMLFNGY